jgi:hypothetical protein
MTASANNTGANSQLGSNLFNATYTPSADRSMFTFGPQPPAAQQMAAKQPPNGSFNAALHAEAQAAFANAFSSAFSKSALASAASAFRNLGETASRFFQDSAIGAWIERRFLGRAELPLGFDRALLAYLKGDWAEVYARPAAFFAEGFAAQTPAERANILRMLHEAGLFLSPKELADALKRLAAAEASTDPFRSPTTKDTKEQEAVVDDRRATAKSEEGLDGRATKLRDRREVEVNIHHDHLADDREKHAETFFMEAREEEDEREEREGLHEHEVFDDHTRCRGTLEDGGRCLRSAVEGTPYCREHAVALWSGREYPLEVECAHEEHETCELCEPLDLPEHFEVEPPVPASAVVVTE